VLAAATAAKAQQAEQVAAGHPDHPSFRDGRRSVLCAAVLRTAPKLGYSALQRDGRRAFKGRDSAGGGRLQGKGGALDSGQGLAVQRETGAGLLPPQLASQR